MTVTLAPMEGVVDYHMRNLMTQIGGYDLCVSEFVRVSDCILPNSVYFRYIPELAHGGKTKAGVPVHVQFMGCDPNLVAENAAYVVDELGALGIDLNFGCPSKVVNRKIAGAAMLQHPDRIHAMVAAVRRAVRPEIQVSAKMRLGYEDKSLALENACAIESAGADKLTVHARTKLEGYRPPAHWEWLAKIREVVSLPMVANGEIWTPEDATNCAKISGCSDVMIGRGAIARPWLAQEIKGQQSATWTDVVPFILDYLRMIKAEPRNASIEGRVKQWVKLLGRTYPEAAALFQVIKLTHDVAEIGRILHSPLVFGLSERAANQEEVLYAG